MGLIVLLHTHTLHPLQSNNRYWSMMSAQINGNYLMNSVLGRSGRPLWNSEGVESSPKCEKPDAFDCILAGFFPQEFATKPHGYPWCQPSYFHSSPSLPKPDPRYRKVRSCGYININISYKYIGGIPGPLTVEFFPVSLLAPHDLGNVLPTNPLTVESEGL